MTKYLQLLNLGGCYKDVYCFIFSTLLIFQNFHNEKLGNESKQVRLDLNLASSIY